MIKYTLFEGRTSNDNDVVTDFRKKDRALLAFNKSQQAYAVIHVYDGEDYIDTIAEKAIAKAEQSSNPQNGEGK